METSFLSEYQLYRGLMTSKPGRQENYDYFVEEYSRPWSQTARHVELTVLGHEVGINGYTTNRAS